MTPKTLATTAKPILQRSQSLTNVKSTGRPTPLTMPSEGDSGEPQPTNANDTNLQPHPADVDADTLENLFSDTHAESHADTLELTDAKQATLKQQELQKDIAADKAEQKSLKKDMRVQTRLAAFFAKMQAFVDQLTEKYKLPTDALSDLKQLFGQACEKCQNAAATSADKLTRVSESVQKKREEVQRLATQARGEPEGKSARTPELPPIPRSMPPLPAAPTVVESHWEDHFTPNELDLLKRTEAAARAALESPDLDSEILEISDIAHELNLHDLARMDRELTMLSLETPRNLDDDSVPLPQLPQAPSPVPLPAKPDLQAKTDDIETATNKLIEEVHGKTLTSKPSEVEAAVSTAMESLRSETAANQAAIAVQNENIAKTQADIDKLAPDVESAKRQLVGTEDISSQ
jgi:flagellum-specific peptidoglycan hydrolase FlgJ